MFRIGQSSDIHRLQEGRKLILGGVEIAHEKGLLGHSDADALTHAIAESILGALALGDLGSHFPDTASGSHVYALQLSARPEIKNRRKYPRADVSIRDGNKFRKCIQHNRTIWRASASSPAKRYVPGRINWLGR